MENVRRRIRKHVFLDEDIYDWLRLEAAKQQRSVGEVIRHQLDMARKYQEAIRAAENAPVRFLRDMRPR